MVINLERVLKYLMDRFRMVILTLQLLKKFSLEEIIKSGLSLFDIQLTDDQFEKCIKSKETTITTNEPVPFQIDGEYMGEVEKVHVKVLESAIKVAVNE